MALLRRTALFAVLIAGLAVTACAGEAANTGTPVSTPEYLAFRDQPTACGADRPDPAVAMEFTGPDDMREIVIAQVDGTPVKLSDVGTVSRGHQVGEQWA